MYFVVITYPAFSRAEIIVDALSRFSRMLTMSGAQKATMVKTDVGTRNVVEFGYHTGADPHLFDRFGPKGKISRVRSHP